MVVYCVNCGSENPEHAKYCYKCGKSIWQPASVEKPPRQSTSQSPSANDTFLGKTCPYCQVPFKPGADVVSCQNCHMPHHRECWAENGNKCTTFGCAGSTAGSNSGQQNSPGNRRHYESHKENRAVRIISCPHCKAQNRLHHDTDVSAVKCGTCYKPLR